MQAYFPKIAWHKLWQKYMIMKKKWKKKRKKEKNSAFSPSRE